MKAVKNIIAALALVSSCALSASAATVLKVGASPTPHAEILEYIAPELEKEGIKLEIIEFTDYVTPNMALEDGEIDANFFQHLPYLESFCRDRGMDLVSVGGVHVEPMGLFSKNCKTLADLPEGAKIGLPADPTNCGRALLLLQAKGLITLEDGCGLEATELDIDKNPHNFGFCTAEAAQLPRMLEDVDAAVINGNYALSAGLRADRDALCAEGAESPYANIIAVAAGHSNDKAVLALMKALRSSNVAQYLAEKYEGAIVPAF